MTERTLKCYCSCGDAMEVETDNRAVIETLEKWWNTEHIGDGHRPTDRATAAKERNRLEAPSTAGARDSGPVGEGGVQGSLGKGMGDVGDPSGLQRGG